MVLVHHCESLGCDDAVLLGEFIEGESPYSDREDPWEVIAGDGCGEDSVDG